MNEMKKGFIFKKLEKKKVQCLVCNQYCKIPEGGLGVCGVHKNEEGKLYSTVYGRPVTAAVDPIEKKPLFHFKPGTYTFSIATLGCNFSCNFCQNYSISQETSTPAGQYTSPEDIINQAVSYDVSTISYTYTEPTIYVEYVYDISMLARDREISNVWVSNGFMSSQTLDRMDGLIDAVNIDLKSFSEDTYKKYCNGKLQPVLDNIRILAEKGVWVEITTLVVPGMNDSEKELDQIAGFIAGVNPDIPWHISRFHPTYKMTDGYQSTPLKCFDIAIEKARNNGLKYIYIGNVSGNRYENTCCPECNELLIERAGFSVYKNKIENGKCFACKAEIAGRF